MVITNNNNNNNNNNVTVNSLNVPYIVTTQLLHNYIAYKHGLFLGASGPEGLEPKYHSFTQHGLFHAHNCKYRASNSNSNNNNNTGVLIRSYPNQEENKLQRQKIFSFIYPIYNHNWRNISAIFICITRLASNEIF